jgi:hypothetical protein
MTRQKLKRLLSDKYPGATFKDGYNLHPDYKDCLWAEDECYNEDGDLIFDTAAYCDGINPEFKQFIEEQGWQCQVIDNTKFIISQYL